jgi:hypothetical protein
VVALQIGGELVGECDRPDDPFAGRQVPMPILPAWGCACGKKGESQNRSRQPASGGKLELLPECRPDVKGFIAGPRYQPPHTGLGAPGAPPVRKQGDLPNSPGNRPTNKLRLSLLSLRSITPPASGLAGLPSARITTYQEPWRGKRLVRGRSSPCTRAQRKTAARAISQAGEHRTLAGGLAGIHARR